MSREEEAIEIVAEALHCGSLKGKPLGEKREILERWLHEILEQWLQKTNEELEQDAKVQKIEAQIDEVLSNQPKRKERLKPILRLFQYQR
jgi:hypothetical protein